eukprot:COSAG04_NODE_342_length_16268_cov_11.873214_2_plen_120_part_00
MACLNEGKLIDEKVAPARVEEILLGMAAGGYIHRPEQEELLRGAAAAGLSAEDQANLAAGSDSVAVQQGNYPQGPLGNINPTPTAHTYIHLGGRAPHADHGRFAGAQARKCIVAFYHLN